MANAVVGNLFRVTIIGHDARSVLENVRHYRVSAITGAGRTDQAFADAVNQQLSTLYLDTFSDAITLDRFVAQRLSAAGAPLLDAVESVVGLPADGTGAGDQMPAYTAGIISLRTGLAGKSGRGRFFTWAPGESQNAGDGTPNAGWVAAATAFGTALLSPFTITAGPDSLTATPSLFSRVFSNATPLANVLVRSEWGTIRSRKIGKGQ